jgi:hypothetical protein
MMNSNGNRVGFSNGTKKRKSTHQLEEGDKVKLQGAPPVSTQERPAIMPTTTSKGDGDTDTTSPKPSKPGEEVSSE